MKHSIIAAAALTLCSTLATAGTGSEGYFTLYNDTSDNTLIGFYTNDGGGWSDNWIAGEMIGPSESARAEFTADTGSCDQVLSLGWLGTDGSEVMDEPISIDICDASNVYLGDNEITYD